MKASARVLISLLLLTALPSLAQSQDSSGNAKPAQTPTSGAESDSPTAKKKPKKVWTNDDVSKASGGISVVGEANDASGDAKKTTVAAEASDDPRHRQINQYKNQLSKLQSQIDAIDKRINQLKNFKGENTSPSGGINMNQGYDMIPIRDQIKQLEDKKKELRRKMDDLETEAHKNGITPDELR